MSSSVADAARQIASKLSDPAFRKKVAEAITTVFDRHWVREFFKDMARSGFAESILQGLGELSGLASSAGLQSLLADLEEIEKATHIRSMYAMAPEAIERPAPPKSPTYGPPKLEEIRKPKPTPQMPSPSDIARPTRPSSLKPGLDIPSIDASVESLIEEISEISGGSDGRR